MKHRIVIDGFGLGGKDVELRMLNPAAIRKPFQADQ